jgi:hypothetical protein
MDYFDYESAAREATISRDQLSQIIALMKSEFPHDPMMCELHVLRACMAVRDGQVTVERILPAAAAARP